MKLYREVSSVFEDFYDGARICTIIVRIIKYLQCRGSEKLAAQIPTPRADN